MPLMADSAPIRAIFPLMDVDPLLFTKKAAMLDREMVIMADGAPIWTIILRMVVGAILPTNMAIGRA